MKKIFAACAFILGLVAFAPAADDPLTNLKDDTLQFFRPLTGKITGVEGSRALMEISPGTSLRPGMRVLVLREGEAFRHPVTKEVLGRVESISGKVEIREVQGDTVAGMVIEGSAQEGDKVRISETKIKMAFVQSRKVDWYLGDDLYRKLKGSGRIEMVDTALETDDEAKAVEEAKKLGADVALLLTAKEAGSGSLLREQLFWSSDGARFFDAEVKVDAALAKELTLGGDFAALPAGEAIFKYDLPFNARLIASGDFDGDGKQEIALGTGKDIRTFLLAVDLKPLWELKTNREDTYLWIDTLDLDGNGKDELIVTAMRNGTPVDKGSSDAMISTEVQRGDVVSYIYELSGTEFTKLWEGRYFLRKIGANLIAQKHSNDEGYVGDVLTLVRDGNEYKTGEKVTLPTGVNIYDFTYVEGTAGERSLLAYDDAGFLNLYDQRGIRVWRSIADTGGFITTFKKSTPAVYVEAKEWSVKDRLITRNREVLAVQRVPLAEFVRGIGHKSSRVKSYWWNGFSMEDRILLNDIPGSLLDYSLVGDKMIVLASPFLGLKFENILKGESPLGMRLFVYSVQGR
jgi:hypothetical protein